MAREDLRSADECYPLSDSDEMPFLNGGEGGDNYSCPNPQPSGNLHDRNQPYCAACDKADGPRNSERRDYVWNTLHFTSTFRNHPNQGAFCRRGSIGQISEELSAPLPHGRNADILERNPPGYGGRFPETRGSSPTRFHRP